MDRSVQGWEKGKKRATLACHSECLHNGIILIVYILQICCCKGTTFFEIAKSFLPNMRKIAKCFLPKMRKIAKCLTCKLAN